MLTLALPVFLPQKGLQIAFIYIFHTHEHGYELFCASCKGNARSQYTGQALMWVIMASNF